MLKLIFWDVQHGHAVLVETDNRYLAFDLGTGSYGSSGNEFSPLLHLKNNYKINQLDGVIITHPHSDHIYDILNFDNLSPKVLYRPRHLTEEEIRKGNIASDKQYVDKYIEIDNRYNNPIPEDENPFYPKNNGDVKFQLFTPSNLSRSNLNNHSIVTVISHASSKVIIPGDNENASWNELLEDVEFQNAISGTDILMAPHHGRESGYSEALFEHISPYLTIVSDGAETDTSATSRYSNKSKGWGVRKRNGTKEQRKCLTTRNDGVIVIEFGYNDENKPYIQATID